MACRTGRPARHDVPVPDAIPPQRRRPLRGAPLGRRAGLVALATVVALAPAACGGDDGAEDAPNGPTPSGSAAPSSGPSGPPPAPGDLAVAENETREDSVYPQFGDPLVDALHYDLDLAWTPEDSRLAAVETLTFRATADADAVPLDLDDALTISSLRVDGDEVDFRQGDTQVVVDHPVTADQEYRLELTYSGTPEPYPAPSVRPDFAEGVGWHVTDERETWTIQEPYGGFTWYAVNDQPADKALYDFTLTVPEPWTGVANGELTETTETDGLRRTTWHLAEPASSYLVTVAFADYEVTELESESGVPITIWTPSDDPAAIGETEYAPEAMAWLEQYLGPYPFDTFGILVYDGSSGMETQTMVTLGNTRYSTSAAVVVHELAHHWYGDTVTPADWSDVWMNEGMATYLQGMWEAEQEGISVDAKMDQWAAVEKYERAGAGPPADFDPTRFGAGNIYYGPALMWHELRERLGDDAFFALVRDWPAEQENDTADRDEYWAWLEEETGLELTAFLEDWLLGARTPARD